MNTVRSLITDQENPYTQLDIRYQNDLGLVWYYMRPKPRACFNPVLLEEIGNWQRTLSMQAGDKVRYAVFASAIPGIFCMGGDLELFISHIRQQNKIGLASYIRACIDTMYLNHVGLKKNITTISLIQGDALGGGMEAAISSQVVIAERDSKMGLPDILFNLFPGAGAYSMLSRKIGSREAERMVLSGRLYGAEEMYEMGVVDILAEKGRGELAVYEYIQKEEKQRNGICAFRKAKQCCNPVTKDELLAAGDIWVDAALNLRDKDLRMMERLVRRQSARAS